MNLFFVLISKFNHENDKKMVFYNIFYFNFLNF
jgi:hypothetical protein